MGTLNRPATDPSPEALAKGEDGRPPTVRTVTREGAHS
jgi:hypothetical protein